MYVFYRMKWLILCDLRAQRLRQYLRKYLHKMTEYEGIYPSWIICPCPIFVFCSAFSSLQVGLPTARGETWRILASLRGIPRRKRRAQRHLCRWLPVLRQESFDESRVNLSGAEIGVGQDFAVQWNRGVDTFYDEHFQSSRHAGDSFCTVFAAHD